MEIILYLVVHGDNPLYLDGVTENHRIQSGGDYPLTIAPCPDEPYAQLSR